MTIEDIEKVIKDKMKELNIMSIEEIAKVIEDKMKELEGLVAQTNDERDKLEKILQGMAEDVMRANEDAQKLRKALFVIRGQETKASSVSDVFMNIEDNLARML